MNLVPKAGLAAVLLLTLIWFGCGDVYRPVASPILKPGGQPSAGGKLAVVVNNADGGFGTTTQINVPGDSNVGNFSVGRGPVYATFNPGQTEIFVANSGDDSISYYFPTVTAAGSVASSIFLPPGSRPVFLVMNFGANLYSANSGTNSVGVISATLSAMTAAVPVGRNPVALAETSDGSKVYCVNNADNTVSVISTIDNTVQGAPIRVGSSPVWAAMSPDGSTVYVVNQGSNSVSMINTTTDTVVGELAVGTAPNFLLVDTHLNRLYVTNTGSGNVTVFDASGSTPVSLGMVPVGHAPVSVTALADGSRVYVANSADNNVTVIDATNLTPHPNPIAVGSTPIWIGSSSDSAKVFVANRDSNSVSDITTLTDSVVATLATGSARPVFLMVTK